MGLLFFVVLISNLLLLTSAQTCNVPSDCPDKQCLGAAQCINNGCVYPLSSTLNHPCNVSMEIQLQISISVLMAPAMDIQQIVHLLF